MTKTLVKIKLKKWIQKKNESFTIREAVKSLDIPNNKYKITLSVIRVMQYVRSTNAASFNKKTKKWTPKNIIMPKKLSKIMKN